MKNNEYKTPEIEVITFEDEDIIRTSNGFGDPFNPDNGDMNVDNGNLFN